MLAVHLFCCRVSLCVRVTVWMSSSQKQIYSVNSDNAYVWEQGKDMTSLPIHIRTGLWRGEWGSLTNQSWTMAFTGLNIWSMDRLDLKWMLWLVMSKEKTEMKQQSTEDHLWFKSKKKSRTSESTTQFLHCWTMLDQCPLTFSLQYIKHIQI